MRYNSFVFLTGRKSHKGRYRTFTAPDEIDRQLGLAKTLDTDEPGSSSKAPAESDSGSESDDTGNGDDGSARAKGVSHLIEVHNPNQDGPRDGPSRKEAEAAARAVKDPLKLKSEIELASDLARLALVRKEREQAALKREQEKQAREAAREAAAQRAQAKLEASRQKGASKPGAKRSETSKKSSKTGSTEKSHAITTSDVHPSAGDKSPKCNT
ncbi:heat-and acid-stable phosphoprotein [Fasciola hepatica]|uniref:Heat-and acid-stable phosphoprotein n=1 Tax=Fasciola hepatica TaxID=6192 RepID=A0A4E0RKQ7_FASHE|nr:heat-and acid-stable phosphoprotein [Fasciola hepatica]